MNRRYPLPRWTLLLLALFVGAVSAWSQTPPASTLAPGCCLSVREFGATGDGKTMDTAALQKAINTAASRGGGLVFVPAGTYLTAPIFLKSFVTLYLDSGATLLGSRNWDDYPTVEGRWEGLMVKHRAGLISAVDAEHVAVIGRGVVDGQGEVWWSAIWKRKAEEKQAKSPSAKPKNASKPKPAKVKAADAKTSTTKKVATAPARKPAVEKKAAPKAEVFDFPRPRLLNFINCKNVLVQGITLQNSPAWTVHPAFCENVVVDGITINNPANSPNTDGINPDSCVNVRIANCLLNCGDDCITLKSGKDEEGRRIGRPTENVTISNCVMLRGHGGVVIGSEMSGGVRDVTVTGCVFRGTDTGIRIKSARGRGGVVENITVSNIAMHGIAREAIVLMTSYGGVSAPEPFSERTPTFRHIALSHIRVDGARDAAFIEGLAEKPLQDVSLADIDARTSSGVRINLARGVSLERITVQVEKGAGLTASNSDELKINDFRAVPSSQVPAIIFDNVVTAWIHDCQAPEATKTFLQVAGEQTRRILLTGNELSGATMGGVELKEGVPARTVIRRD